ncbi:MAG: hypothetical protein JWM70_255 [Microbacteriaceae bacterium]|nr:hypothetical protein [Microbacteriaceae bacterium]
MTLDTFARDGLILTHQIRPHFDDHRMIRRAVDRGELVRLRRGVYIDGDSWNSADARERHVLRIRATLAVAERPVVIAGISAAALWGVPIAGDWPLETTVLDEWRGGGRSEPGVKRTAAGFRTANTVELGGIRVTNLSRTVLDLARTHSFVDAVGSLDWALWRRNEARVTIDDLVDELEALLPRTGRHHLERVVGFATHLSDSFGESRARAVIHQLGFDAPDLQAEFRDGRGRMVVDFLWRRAGIVGEFDGKEKYTRDEYAMGQPGEVAWREKKREDRLRQMGFGVVRILTSHVAHPKELERLLLDAGVPRRGGS